MNRRNKLFIFGLILLVLFMVSSASASGFHPHQLVKTLRMWFQMMIIWLMDWMLW